MGRAGVLACAGSVLGAVALFAWNAQADRFAVRVARMEADGFRLDTVWFGDWPLHHYEPEPESPLAALDAATVLDVVAWQSLATRRLPRRARAELDATWRRLIRAALTKPEFSRRGAFHLRAVSRLGARGGDAELQLRWSARRGSIAAEALSIVRGARERGLLTPAAAARCLRTLRETMPSWVRLRRHGVEALLRREVAELHVGGRNSIWSRAGTRLDFWLRVERGLSALDEARDWIDGDETEVRRRIDTAMPKDVREELHRIVDGSNQALEAWLEACTICESAMNDRSGR